MSAVYSGDITWRYTVAAAYGIQYDRAIKISREGVPTRSRPCSFNVDVYHVQRGSMSRFICEDAHTHMYKCTHIRVQTRVCSHVPRGIIENPGTSICATNHDHPMRYRDRWHVYSLPTHCAEIKFYPPRWRTRPANRSFYVTRLARQMCQSFLDM